MGVIQQNQHVFINACFGYGQSKEGVELAPSQICIEYPNIKSISCNDNQNGNCNNIDNFFSSIEKEGKELKNIELVQMSIKSVFDATMKALNANEFPIILGGDHSISMGSISAISVKYSNKLLIVWIDAHADINTPSSSKSGNAHGCPVSYLLGLWGSVFEIHNIHVIYIGIRDVEMQEWEIIKENKNRINCITMKDYKKEGIKSLIEIMNHYDNVHISLDVDSMDPIWCPSTGTPVPDGFTPDQVIDMLKSIKDSGKLRSMDLVEFNPHIGTPENVKKTTNCIKKIINAILSN